MSNQSDDADVLLGLLAQPTSSFHEHNAIAWIWRFAAERGLPAELDRVGNLTVAWDPPGGEGREPTWFSAHLDHPGFWALDPLSSNRQRSHFMGRFDAERMIGRPVRFWSGGEPVARRVPELAGVFGDPGFRLGGAVVRGRVLETEGSNELGDVARVVVDVDEPLDPGSIGMWDVPGPEISGGRVVAPAVDDLAGAAAMLRLLDRLREARSPHPARCLFTRAEEGGFFGCIDWCRERIAGGEVPERPVVGLETSMAKEDTPLGSGVVIRVGDRRHAFDPAWVDAAGRAAARLAERDPAFAWSRRLMDGGTCESSVYQAFFGRAGALCIPLANYHNVDPGTGELAAEAIDLGDFRRLVDLCCELASGVDPGPSRAFRGWCEAWADRHRSLYTEPGGLAE